MNLNEEKIEDLTGKLLKKTGMEEPSSQFTDKVMQSVFALKPQVGKSKLIHYTWLLIVIPLLVAGGWYLSGFSGITGKVLNILAFIGLYSSSFFSILANSFQPLVNISVSPIVLIGALAIFFLILIEILLTRKKYRV